MIESAQKTDAPVCPTCNKVARLTDGGEIYPNACFVHLRLKPFWVCDGCGAYVGCHPGTANPLGTPAGPELRRARGATHRLLDPLWKFAWDGDRGSLHSPKKRRAIAMQARRKVYAFLANRMGMSIDECHVAMFDIDQCRSARDAVRGVTYAEISAWSSKAGHS